MVPGPRGASASAPPGPGPRGAAEPPSPPPAWRRCWAGSGDRCGGSGLPAPCIWPGWAAQPPPGTITAGSSAATAAWTALCSISRKRGSPTIPKICATGMPISRTSSWSMSNRGAPSASATWRPTALLPAARKPDEHEMARHQPGPPALAAIRRRSSGQPSGRHVCLVVAPHLGQRVAAELLQHRVRQRQGDHRLRDHAERGYGGHVGPLALSVGRLTGGEIHGRQRRHQGGDRLHRHPDHHRLAGGDPALEPAGIVAAAGGSRPGGRPLRSGRLRPPARRGRGSIGSCTSEPGRRAAAKPMPISTPLTAGMDMSRPASRPSSLRSQLTWLPRPTTTPRATTSTSPPSVSPACFASSIRRDDLGLDRRVEHAHLGAVGGLVERHGQLGRARPR